MFPLNQTDITVQGPLACAESCLEIDGTYVYFLVHVPASGSFVNKLVCGCGYLGVLQSAPDVLDSSCNLPCPQGGNDTVDAVQLTGGIQTTEEMAPRFPNKPSPSSHNKNRLLTVPGGVAGLKNPGQIRKRQPPSHRTCGNGHGLLSVYEFLQTNSANNSRQLRCLAILLALLILCWA